MGKFIVLKDDGSIYWTEKEYNKIDFCVVIDCENMKECSPDTNWKWKKIKKK